LKDSSTLTHKPYPSSIKLVH